MSEDKLDSYFFTAVLIAVLVAVAILFYPFLGALALALVLATLVTPLHVLVCKYVKLESVAALLIVLFVFIVVLVPIMGLFFLLVDEVRGISDYVASLDLSAMPAFVELFELKMKIIFPMFEGFDVPTLLQNVVTNLGAFFAAAVTGTADLAIKLFVAAIALYYFVKDRKTFLKSFIALSPLRDDEDAQIVQKLKNVSHSLIRGTLVIAFLQGILTGVGLLMFGVPNPVLWGSFAMITALIPTVGTSIVAVPAIVYLLFTGHFAAALGLFAWSLLFVGIVDNLLRPKLIAGDTNIHPLFILLSVLGGLMLFGIAGFLLGPLLVGLLVALAEIYKDKIKILHASST